MFESRTSISLELARDGVRAVQPSDAVVAELDLSTVAEAARLIDAARADAEVCTQQTFFANPDAAQAGWTSTPAGASSR